MILLYTMHTKHRHLCDKNNGSSPPSSHHCELQKWFQSGQQTPKLKKNILVRVYISQHKILNKFIIFGFALHLRVSCLLQKRQFLC